MIQTVRLCSEDPLQAEWDDIVERLLYAIDNFRDAARKDTHIYLVHGLDAHSTLKSVTDSIRQTLTGHAKR